MNVAILYSNYLNSDGTQRKVGGIETYLTALARLCHEIGLEPTIYQHSIKPFRTVIDEIEVKGIPVQKYPVRKRSLKLYKAVLKQIDKDNDIVLFGSDSQSVKNTMKRALSIQHGVSWDLPAKYMTQYSMFHKGPLSRLYKLIVQRRFIRYYENCLNRVCVDSNFINWYKTCTGEDIEGRNWIIRNSAKIAQKKDLVIRKSNNRTIRILFARRFCEFRGTRIMEAVVKDILSKHSHVQFSFAGEGPEEVRLKKIFYDEEKVKFIKYHPDETLRIHLQHQIAIVPSLASEGTSLAVVEAMAAGCAVVASCVGGITDLIIDQFNGLLVYPQIKNFTNAIDSLILNYTLLDELGRNAHHVAEKSFSINTWKDKWTQVFEELGNA